MRKIILGMLLIIGSTAVAQDGGGGLGTNWRPVLTSPTLEVRQPVSPVELNPPVVLSSLKELDYKTAQLERKVAGMQKCITELYSRVIKLERNKK